MPIASDVSKIFQFQTCSSLLITVFQSGIALHCTTQYFGGVSIFDPWGKGTCEAHSAVHAGVSVVFRHDIKGGGPAPQGPVADQAAFGF